MVVAVWKRLAVAVGVERAIRWVVVVVVIET
jgi:hypothetical protein